MFKCDCCGLCCRHIDCSFTDSGLDRGDGVCVYFDEISSLCKIYEERPLICNVDKFYEEYLIGMISREAFYRINYSSPRG